MRKLTTNDFIEKAIIIHGNKYDYSKVEYNGSDNKVTIICPEHGEFSQIAYSHLSGNRCKKCGYKLVTKKQTDNKEKFLEKAKKIHGDKYNYSKVNYIFSNRKVEIICNEHGSFKQTPNKHLLGQGCRRCGYLNFTGVSKDLLGDAKRLKRAISSIYYRGTYTKNTFMYNIIGCDWSTFKSHLEDNEFELKVGQKGIDLDHIIPISSATTKKELYNLHHYSNFQLLPAYYNRYLKKTKEFNKEHFKKWINDYSYKETIQ